MMIEIANNEHYKIFVDAEKNRAYCTIIGRWTSTQMVKSYFPDWKEAVSLLQPNFTILADIRLMGNMPKEVELLHQNIQTYLIEHGMLVTAQLASLDEIADYQIHRSTQRSKFPIFKFSSRQMPKNSWTNQYVSFN